MVGELEAALEAAAGDAAIEHLAVLAVLDLLLALHGQRVLARLDRELLASLKPATAMVMR